MAAVIRLHRVGWPVTSLGHGARLVVWTQGCHIGCAGCMSPDTWDPASGGEVPVDELVARICWIVTTEGLDGVSISGGEPTEQALELEALLCGLQPLRAQDVDLLLFSGLTPDRFRERHAALLELLDAAVIGPYHAVSPGRPPLLASGNQELLVCSDLGRACYQQPVVPASPRIQIAADPGGGVMLIGIPRGGDVDRLRSALTASDVPRKAS